MNFEEREEVRQEMRRRAKVLFEFIDSLTPAQIKEHYIGGNRVATLHYHGEILKWPWIHDIIKENQEKHATQKMKKE